MEVACVRTYKGEHEIKGVAYGIEDDRGREVGILAILWEEAYMQATREQERTGMWHRSVEPGRYFVANIQTTRGGKRYGAVQPDQLFKTTEERDTYVAKRVEDGRKQATKKFGVC